MKRFLDRWCGALWHFRCYRRWYIRRYAMRRLFAPAHNPTRRMAAQLATNRRFLHDIAVACAEAEEWYGLRELVDSAIGYCPECPIQGTCGTCGRYHGATQ
ncbi:MAG TPA: hypothetical protein VJQ82_17985 [Terriglobales bacterium]|nr:hypothetical protein [Terriglobales bacterium]